MATKADTITNLKSGGTDMAGVLDAQRRAFLNECPVSAEMRISRINRAIAILVDHQDRLCDAMAEDFSGRPKLMSRLTDIMSAVKALKFARSHVKSWMRPEKRKLEFPLGLLGARARVEFQPKGVVGLISPWNFPVNLTFGPLAGIFAAGNRVMIKPSEHTPATSQTMKELFESSYDETEAAVFTGGPDVGQAFTGLAFDHLLFTGATAIGKHVMHAAAENLVPVTLELGGKSPVIIGQRVDVHQAANRIVLGKMLNAGQICLAPDYLLVPEDREMHMIGAIRDRAAELYPTIKDNPDYTSIINERHRNRLRTYIDDATGKGAEAITVNPADEDFGANDNSLALPLTLLRQVNDDMTVMQEEIFGPLLPVVTYSNIEEAIRYVNARPRPLGLYYFGTDSDEEERVLDQTISGGVTVNDVVWHVGHEDLPFGGIGPSGMGVYHGEDGFRTFSHAKSVFTQTNRNLMKLIGALPPYGKKLERTLKFQIRK